MAQSVAADPLVGSAWTHGRVGAEEGGSTGRTPANGARPAPSRTLCGSQAKLLASWKALREAHKEILVQSLSKPHTAVTPLRCPDAVPSWKACFVTHTPLALRASRTQMLEIFI